MYKYVCRCATSKLSPFKIIILQRRFIFDFDYCTASKS